MTTLAALPLILAAGSHGHYINDSILPPQLPFSGASQSLQRSADDPLATPAEQMRLADSPDYQTSFAWLDKLVATSDKLQKVSIGQSAQGRQLWMIIASDSGASNAEALAANGKPTLLWQAGIHAGEIDGKDAGMMLLRDIVQGDKADLLKGANLLFVPIFNADGHERRGLYNRVNQRGPVTMGWRTTSTNLNLNRDYAKADTPEMQAMLKAINQWQPDLYIDAHVTDGIDYQYDVTYGYNLDVGYSPAIHQWLEHTYRPAMDARLTQMGHTPGPLVFAIDNGDMSKGLSLWNASPRYSNGYGDARHLPTILLENHSLKPYQQRVLGTYVMLEQSLKLLASDGASLKQAVNADQQRHSSPITLSWSSEQQAKGWDFKGVDYRIETSPISGSEVVRWLGTPKLYPNLPVIGNTKAKVRIERPQAYYIPPQWHHVIERLQVHGIQMTRLEQEQVIEGSSYRLTEPKFATRSYEGRQRVSATANLIYEKRTLPKGSWRVDTKQPLGDLAILLLEPQSSDSLLQWGFFNTIFTRTEYIEAYAVEPLAQQMLDSDPELAKKFKQKLENDSEFKNNPKARLAWFYRNSSYFDFTYQVYPIFRK